MTLKADHKHAVLVLCTLVFYLIMKTDAVFLRYACKPNGDLSVMNVNTSYRSVLAFNTMGRCNSDIVKNFTVVKITNCPPGDESGIVKIILSQLKKDSLDYVGGRDQITSSLRCSMPKRATSSLVRINMRVRGLFRQVSGFSDGFYKREPVLSVELYDLTGETGYDVFTISYPIGIVITGPPESDILPEVCHAYSARNIENGLTARVLKDGCALDHKLMFSFSKQPADWFDRNITEFDMDRFIINPGMFDDFVEEEPEEPPLPPAPQLFTHMYAFRFFLSNYLLVHCEVRICPPGSEGCHLSCNDTINPDENEQTNLKTGEEQLKDLGETETDIKPDESESDAKPEEDKEMEELDNTTEQTLTTVSVQENDKRTYSNQIVGGKRADTNQRVPITTQSVTKTVTTADVGDTDEENEKSALPDEMVEKVTQSTGTTLPLEEVLTTTEFYDEENEVSSTIELIPSRSHRRKRAIRRNDDVQSWQGVTTETIFRTYIIRRNSALKPHYVWDTLPKSHFGKYVSKGEKKVGDLEADKYTISGDELKSHRRVPMQRGQN